MDTIIIQDLAVLYRVGAPDAERATPQKLLITVELGCDFSRAAAADDLKHTIDYHAVCNRLLGLGEGRKWKLIETLAVEIAELMLAEFGARTASVEVKKFILPDPRHVAVRVTRSRSV
ncbi:MAG: dihydroneopterin aldolase [Verrucomicrobia bacterium]|nr:dihydroneopterin aldolase [Verrucomicrobiota bacterium]